MITQLLSQPSFLMINISMVISYCLALSIFKFPFIKKLSEKNKLKLSRFLFVSSIFAFLCMPYVATLYPIDELGLEFTPILKSASTLLDTSKQPMNLSLTESAKVTVHFSMLTFISYLWLIGFFIYTFRYVKTLILLNKLSKNAFCQHRLHQVRVLFSDYITIPFCWSFFNRHFLVLPNSLLENTHDKHLAIRHELQHIRQGDTYWLHITSIIKLFCFWNPFLKNWMNWLNDLQEYACDEQIILQSKISPSKYATCLMNTLQNATKLNPFSHNVLAINNMPASKLYRRINMLFDYKHQTKKLSLLIAYIISFLVIASSAFAINGSPYLKLLSSNDVINAIKKSDINKAMRIDATPEVVKEINRIRLGKKSSLKMKLALKRMKEYKPFIQTELTAYAMPNDLLAIPLVESGYQPLDESKNVVAAAGIWQIIPSTGQHLGLTINKERDDRLNTA